MICFRWSRPSAWKKMISSIRFRNSGRKCARSASSTRRLGAFADRASVDRLLGDVLAAEVRRHDHDGVLEVDRAALAVGQAPVVEQLEQDVQHLRVRFLDLVEQDDGIGPPAHRLGELAGFVVADVSGRRADQARHRVLLLVLGHVDPDHRLLVVEQELGQRPRQLGLAHAGRSEEEEAAERAVGILQTGPGAADRVRHGVDRLVLTDDALVQPLLHVNELLHLALQQPGDRACASTC